MKIALTLLTIAALTAPAFAQAKKEIEKVPAPAAAEQTKPDKKPREAKTADETAPKALPMHARADAIDAATKTFTQKRKDGVEVKHVVTEKTEIKQGDTAAKFEDIKVGDQVSGSRIKKSDTEYEVVKVTKFGPSEKKTKETEKKEKPADEKKM